MTADQLLTMKQTAARLAVSLKTAYRRVYANEIPWVNVAPPGARRASIRVAESAVAEFIARHTRGAV
jgi:predicted DNA-binding transcriptional regulator AlpA